MIPCQNKMKIASYKKLLKIKVDDSGEEMVNISKTLKNCICVYEKFDMVKYLGNDIWVRKTVAKKLATISRKLRKRFPYFKLKIVYGYRHPSIQKKYFSKQNKILKLQYPQTTPERLNELTHSMVAFPKVSGHPTGGAIDITITTSKGDLDMGTKIADYSNPKKIKTFTKLLTKTQTKNRKLLHDLMVTENFAPFYGEWWHFSYGDKEWAWFYEKENALYDQIKLQN